VLPSLEWTCFSRPLNILPRISCGRLVSATAGAAITLVALWLALVTAAAATVILRALEPRPISPISRRKRYSLTAIGSRPLSFVSSMLPTRPSRLCRFLLIVLARPSPVFLHMLFPLDYACATFFSFCTVLACVFFLLLPRVEWWPRGGRVRSCVFLGATIES